MRTYKQIDIDDTMPLYSDEYNSHVYKVRKIFRETNPSEFDIMEIPYDNKSMHSSMYSIYYNIKTDQVYTYQVIIYTLEPQLSILDRILYILFDRFKKYRNEQDIIMITKETDKSIHGSNRYTTNNPLTEIRNPITKKQIKRIIEKTINELI